MNARALRDRTFAFLENLGFRPADNLPLPDVNCRLRPLAEIAARLMALDAVFTWVASSETNAAANRVRSYIHKNRLAEWMEPEEAAIVDLTRSNAHEAHVDTIGWKLENMWPLAWVLGYPVEPTLDATQIDSSISP
ncbi:MAG: DUF4272 domain-containing protein [Gemmataceae bacterium]|nr:DUF4272 domain-containing protein [Gemmataceae bacterium]